MARVLKGGGTLRYIEYCQSAAGIDARHSALRHIVMTTYQQRRVGTLILLFCTRKEKLQSESPDVTSPLQIE